MAFLRKTNVYDKSIIFCVDIEHATRMRLAIVNEAPELVLENYKAQQVLHALLDKYADDGIENIGNLDVLRLEPINTLGRPIEIFNLFGGKEKYLSALKDLETEIYRMAA